MSEVVATVGEIELDPCPACNGQGYVPTEVPGPGGGDYTYTSAITCHLCRGDEVAYVDAGTRRVNPK